MRHPAILWKRARGLLYPATRLRKLKMRRPSNSFTPYVIEDTGRSERSMDIYSRLLKDRIIFIGTDINEQIENVVVAQLLFLKMEDPKKDINLYINSNGGGITAG